MYVDGGNVTPLPLRVAMQRGAKEIYALHIRDEEPQGTEKRLIKGVAGVLSHSVGMMLRLQAQHDLLLAEVRSKSKLYYIPLSIHNRPAPTDFSQAQPMIDAGYQVTEEYFANLKKGKQHKLASPSVRQWFSSHTHRFWTPRIAHKRPASVEVTTNGFGHHRSSDS